MDIMGYIYVIVYLKTILLNKFRVFHHTKILLIFHLVEMLLKHGITPIFCCGESLSDRESKNHFNVVKSQLSQIISNLSTKEFSEIIIAYEPVWAIGTGLTADPQDAQDMHSFIRGLISEVFGKEISNQTSIYSIYNTI